MHQCIHRRQGLELVGGGDKGQAREARQFGRGLFGIALGRVQARTDGRAAQGQFIQVRQRGTHVALAMVQLRHIARELLAQRERGGVLQVGAADLDDAIEVFRLLRQRGAQLGNGGQQAVRERLHGRHVHGGGEHIVARLAAVHIVVGVHQAAFATLATQQFARAVGQHLVDIHVGLRARAGLPHHQRKFTRVLAGDDFVSGGHDGRGLLRVLQAQGLVDHGRGALDLGQRLDDLARLLLARDVEVLQRSLRLRAPQLVDRDFDGAKGVAFFAELHEIRLLVNGCIGGSARLTGKHGLIPADPALFAQCDSSCALVLMRACLPTANGAFPNARFRRTAEQRWLTTNLTDSDVSRP